MRHSIAPPSRLPNHRSFSSWITHIVIDLKIQAQNKEKYQIDNERLIQWSKHKADLSGCYRRRDTTHIWLIENIDILIDELVRRNSGESTIHAIDINDINRISDAVFLLIQECTSEVIRHF